VAWIAGARKAGEPLGAVTSATGESFEPFACAPKVASRVLATVDAAAAALSLAEWALFELHVDAEGQTAIVSVDPLPALDDASAMLASLQARGLSIDTVVTRILTAAKARLHFADKFPSRSGREPIRVGLTFNVKRIKPLLGGKNDEEAEFDSPATIEAIANAIRSHGHTVVLMEANPALASSIRDGFVDVVFNIAEVLRGRSR
jgi:D-alanine-D-alanine ligase